MMKAKLWLFVTSVVAFGLGRPASAQSVQPVIAEYTDHAAGSFAVSNTTLVPMAVVLEPKSFGIDIDGKGSYRALDPEIHLELSATSLRLEPRQTATIFYKVSGAATPQWMCIYATFSAIHRGPGINVKIMLPHTVYVYQRQSLTRELIHVDSLAYDALSHRVLVQVTNQSANAGRAESVEVTGPHGSATASGFPLLPHQSRRLSIEWKSVQAPTEISIEFGRFHVKSRIEQIPMEEAARAFDLGGALPAAVLAGARPQGSDVK